MPAPTFETHLSHCSLRSILLCLFIYSIHTFSCSFIPDPVYDPPALDQKARPEKREHSGYGIDKLQHHCQDAPDQLQDGPVPVAHLHGTVCLIIVLYSGNFLYRQRHEEEIAHSDRTASGCADQNRQSHRDLFRKSLVQPEEYQYHQSAQDQGSERHERRLIFDRFLQFQIQTLSKSKPLSRNLQIRIFKSESSNPNL